MKGVEGSLVDKAAIVRDIAEEAMEANGDGLTRKDAETFKSVYFKADLDEVKNFLCDFIAQANRARVAEDEGREMLVPDAASRKAQTSYHSATLCSLVEMVCTAPASNLALTLTRIEPKIIVWLPPNYEKPTRVSRIFKKRVFDLFEDIRRIYADDDLKIRIIKKRKELAKGKEDEGKEEGDT